MRANEILRARNEQERATIARMLGAESASDDHLLAAMRDATLHARLVRRCDNDVMREDLSLLCANPFDTVLSDELVDPLMFRQIGLIHEAPDEEGFRVNLDMALSMVPSVRIEFGFAATLLARMAEDALAQLSRALEVGPRASRVDLLIAMAERMVDAALVQRRLARVSDTQRDVLRRALEAGELPDQLDGLLPDAPPPIVTLVPGEIGVLGLAFMVEEPARGEGPRPAIPLEILPDMALWLDMVPSAPDVGARVTHRPRTRGRGAGSDAATQRRPAPGKPPVRVTPVGLSVPGLVGTRLESRSGDPAPAHAPTPQKISRMVSGAGISAWVDLEDSASLSEIRADAQLDDQVVEYVAGRYALLRPEVDVSEWVNRCAQRLQWETDSTGG